MPRLLALAVLLIAASAPAADPDRYAVLVGVNGYQHRNLPPLEFAVNDATELAGVFKTLGYQVTLLTDATPQKPTRANVDAALKRVLRAAKKGDTVVVGLSGHGLQFGTDKTRGAYFCPLDAVPTEGRAETLVAVSDLYRELEDSFAGVKVLLVDACRNDPKAPATGRTRNGLSAASAAPPQGVAALFSCSRGQVSLEHPEIKHGVFFHHVIEGLNGRAKGADGELTFNSLADYVTKRVARTAARLQPGQIQTPNQRADLEGESPVLGAVTRAPGADDLRRGQDLFFGRNGTPKDEAAASVFYRKAAEAGYPPGMRNLGYLYLSGRGGLAKDETEAVVWFKAAADRGDGYALTQLGRMYAAGRGGLPKDEAEAVRLYRKAAGQGSGDAMYALGFVYLEGRGGEERSEREAAGWFQKAADVGVARGMGWVGKMYSDGWGGYRKDEAEAAKWYKAAADGGDEVAMYNLAVYLTAGRGGLPASRDKAIYWFRKALAAGYKPAAEQLKSLGVTELPPAASN